MSTVFTKAITINAPEKDVVFNGVDFTKDAMIKITAAKSVTIKNCRFYGFEPTAKAMGITLTGDAKLVVEGCFFGDNNDKLYNFFELNGKLANGSSISKNYFTTGCCTHNQVNIYNVEDDAVVSVNSNHLGSSRIGIKGSPKCTIEFIGNEYTPLPDAGDWVNMLLIQPYGKSTTSMSDVIVKVDNTKTDVPSDKLVFLYAGGTDTKFNYQTNYPKLYLNGSLVDEITNMGDPVEGTKNGAEETPVVDPAPSTDDTKTE